MCESAGRAYEVTHGLEFREVGTETLVYDAARDRVHVVNVTAAEILKRCSGKSAGEIAEYLRERFAVKGHAVESDVREILGAFADQGLIRELPA